MSLIESSGVKNQKQLNTLDLIKRMRRNNA